ncbi:tRNA threonylcarbamoyladenosine biosynthesis protein TsaB [hydrothermal vent metagenome]|uniref:tRNA threonylcarbamoyladenosine biosynthesis protein TsaB n=1 Tax=hydrothermal vent metagenome TaxID=652676 RepID=A0A3B0YC40_9ZZZZ
MKILAVDTATEACSAALRIEGETISEFQLAPGAHTQLILQMVERLLQQADIKIAALDALAFGRGPGSFTGVRIATGIVQGLAFASDLGVIPISTLAAIAQRASEEHAHKNVLAGIDARMGEVYWGCYQQADNGLVTLQGTEQVSRPEALEISDPQIDWLGAGSAWGSYAEPLQLKLKPQVSRYDAHCLPSAVHIVQLAQYQYQQGRCVEAAQALPVYLRNDVAKKSTKKV